jgi:hypothetical protein
MLTFVQRVCSYLHQVSLFKNGNNYHKIPVLERL